ncbi:MAG: hypothetical protein ACYDCN_12230 [Bacteroidia bacterium]
MASINEYINLLITDHAKEIDALKNMLEENRTERKTLITAINNLIVPFNKLLEEQTAIKEIIDTKFDKKNVVKTTMEKIRNRFDDKK